MSETGAELAYSEPDSAPTLSVTDMESAAVTAQTAPVVQTAPPKRAVTQL